MGIKYKGAYVPVSKRQYHQDASSGVVQLAVSAAVIEGTPLDQFIYNHTDAFDFMRFVKVNRNNKLFHGNQPVQGNTRYYITLSGPALIKVMPPLAGGVDEREIAIDKGWNVGICNKAWEFDWALLNRRFYLMEAEKLLSGLGWVDPTR